MIPTLSPLSDGSIDMEQEQMDTIKEAHASRPAGTGKAYACKQKEFKAWCMDQLFPDGCTVSPKKLHSFLKHKVIGRKSKVNPSRTITKSTVNLYVAAIVDLYNLQRSTEDNQYVIPHLKCLYSSNILI
jgi:hypothetical protein